MTKKNTHVPFAPLWRLTACLALLALSAPPPRPAAAQLGGPSITVNSCDSDKYPEVTCLVTPVNSAGLPITTLNATAFQVLDGNVTVNDVKVEKVVNAATKTSYMFVTDFGMLGGAQNLQALKDSARAVLSAVGPTDRIGMVAITGKVDVDAAKIDPTKESGFVNASTNRNDIINIVTRLTEVTGTPLYDALCKAIVLTAREASPGSRAIVLFTDGRDAKSTVCTADDPITRANKDRIPIIAIGVGPRVEDSYLRRLATLTDGTFETVADASGLLGRFTNIQTQFRTQYKLTFNATSAADNQRHGITVQLNMPSGRATDRGEYTALLPTLPTLSGLAFKVGGAEIDPLKLPFTGDVSLEPSIKARKLTRVEYSVDGGETKVVDQNPYSLVLRLDSLDPTRPHKLTVRAVGDAQNITVKDFEFGLLPPPPTPTVVPTKTCDLICQAQRNPGVAIPIAIVAIGLPILFFSLIALLAQRSRRRKEAAAMNAYAEDSATSVSNVPIASFGAPTAPSYSPPANMGATMASPLPPPMSAGPEPTSVFSPAPPPPSTMIFGAPVTPGGGATQVFKPGLAKLAFQNGPLAGTPFPLGVPGDSETLIGRKVDGSTARVQLDSPFVSRRHARIYAEGDQLFIADLKSASGTKLNGERLTEAPARLKVGDRLEFADLIAEIKPF